MKARHADLYWRKTRRLTFILLAIWAVVTFSCIWFARSLNEYSLFGFPLGFYMGAQGLPVFYLILILIYNLSMRRLDVRYHHDTE